MAAWLPAGRKGTNHGQSQGMGKKEYLYKTPRVRSAIDGQGSQDRPEERKQSSQAK